VIIIFILTIFSSKNLINRFNVLKKSRRDYYECGFRPSNQKPIRVSIQFIFICIFFIIYDIELVFSFPLVSSITYNSLLDFIGLFLIYGTMIISLVYDFNKNLLN
jgi:NADH-quinone oxidoreductase subunit A